MTNHRCTAQLPDTTPDKDGTGTCFLYAHPTETHHQSRAWFIENGALVRGICHWTSQG